jgi:hypothetical protein
VRKGKKKKKEEKGRGLLVGHFYTTLNLEVGDITSSPSWEAVPDYP